MLQWTISVNLARLRKKSGIGILLIVKLVIDIFILSKVSSLNSVTVVATLDMYLKSSCMNTVYISTLRVVDLAYSRHTVCITNSLCYLLHTQTVCNVYTGCLTVLRTIWVTYSTLPSIICHNMCFNSPLPVTAVLQHKCSRCPYMACTKPLLAEHMRIVHMTSYCLSCDECCFETNMGAQVMEQHKATHDTGMVGKRLRNFIQNPKFHPKQKQSKMTEVNVGSGSLQWVQQCLWEVGHW